MRQAIEPHLLQESEAQIASDTHLEGGAIEGLKGDVVLKALTKGTVNTLWKYPTSNPSNYWLEFTGRADVVRSPVIDDIYDRIYWTDTVGPKYAPASVVLSGASYPGSFYSLGMPSPTTLPTASGVTAGVTGSQEFRAYTETFVSAYGEESPNGPVSAVIDMDPTTSVTIGNLTPVPTPSGGKAWNITHRRLYRTSFTGGTSAGFQLVAQLPVATTSYTDSLAQSSLGATLSSEGYYPPPDGAYGMTVTESGVMVLLKDRDVHLSENSLPHAYDPDFTKRLQYKTVAAAAFEGALVVMTEGDLYVGNGTTPSTMLLTRIPDTQPCLSAAGVVVTRGGAYYPSPEGLIAIGTNFVPTLVTKGMFTRDQWLSYNPASFIAGLWDGKYRAYFKRADNSTGLLIIDPTGKTAPLVLGTQGASAVTAAHQDKTTDILYIARGGNIEAVGTSSTRKAWTWKSKEFRFPFSTILSAFVVYGDPGTLTFKTYLNGALWSTKVLPANKIGRIRTGRPGIRWSFEISGTTKVTEFRVAPSVEELFD
jgi:hypothetical protein